MGSGHVLRCLALAEAWRALGGGAAFAARGLPEGIASRLASESVAVCPISEQADLAQDARETVLLARETAATWVAVDGYGFDSHYVEFLSEAGLKVLQLDDGGQLDRYGVDLVLNQNLHANPDLYEGRCRPETRFLYGPRHALLRREFWPYRGKRHHVREVGRRALVTFGGSDPDRMSAPILEALHRLDTTQTLEGTAVIGPSHRSAESIVRLGQLLGPRWQVLTNTNEMPSLMDHADVAIGNAGSTAWEMAFMGLPAVLAVAAENQVGVAEGLQSLGVAWSCGPSGGKAVPDMAERLVSLLADRATRQTMSNAGQALVDGYGADRVVAAMIGSGVWLRRAGPEDCRKVWEWANEGAARASSFSSDPIPWSDHERWFDARLREERFRILIACDADDNEIGYVRMETEAESNEATISICVTPERRGRGFGRLMIERAMAPANAWQPDRLVHAYIRPENAASVRAFAGAGFFPAGQEVIRGVLALHYLYVRPGGARQ